MNLTDTFDVKARVREWKRALHIAQNASFIKAKKNVSKGVKYFKLWERKKSAVYHKLYHTIYFFFFAFHAKN